MKIGNLDISKLYLGGNEVDKMYLGEALVYPTEEPVTCTALCFTAEKAGSKVQLKQYGTFAGTDDYEISTNGKDWSAYNIGDEVTLAKTGDKVYFRGNYDTEHPQSTSHLKYFAMSGSIAASGNVNSLLIKEGYDEMLDLTGYDFCLWRLFWSCEVLTTAPELPATTLAPYCYLGMFLGCSHLITAPELPATTLAESCYNQLFNGCTRLATAPELPATVLARNCYDSMFYECKTLTTAPELLATTLAFECYRFMFYRCTQLNYVKHHVTNWNKSNTSDWLYGTAETGIVECPAASTIPSDSTDGIPSGWERKNF